jgi:glycosyltransferase involved in cell wall biosynthesis
MFHHSGNPDFRGIFVTQLWNAVSSHPGIEASLEVVAQGKGRLDYLTANSRIKRRWGTERHDLAHVHYGLTGLASLLLPKSAPVVATFYGSDINSTLQRWVSKASLGRASRRIYVSKSLANRWPSLRNEVIPNGVDFDVVAPLDRELACNELGLDPSREWILFGGSPANPVKDYGLFREVLALVQAKNPRVQELILSEKGQAYERVVLKLNAASCLLFTSRRGSEGSPTVVKEALAVGLPVVSVEVGDAREMLEGIHPGAVVSWPSSNGASLRAELAKELAAHLLRVLENRGRSNGREKRQSLRQELIVQRIVEIYREVAANRGRN